MRFSRRIVIVGALVAVFGLLIGSMASSRQVMELPEYTGFSGYPLHESDLEIEVGEPFYFKNGDGNVMPGYSPGGYTIHLFLNGSEVEPTYVGCTTPFGDPSAVSPQDNCRDFVWDYPDGLLVAIEYDVVVMFSVPCGELAVGGQHEGNAAFGDFQIQSCLNDQMPMIHPGLSGFKTLTVTAAP